MPHFVPSVRLYANTIFFRRLIMDGGGLAHLQKREAKIDSLSREICRKRIRPAKAADKVAESISAGLKEKTFGEYYSDGAKLDFGITATGILVGIVDLAFKVLFCRAVAVIGLVCGLYWFSQDIGEFRQSLADKISDAIGKTEKK